MDLALNNLQRLICHKTKPNHPLKIDHMSNPPCDVFKIHELTWLVKVQMYNITLYEIIQVSFTIFECYSISPENDRMWSMLLFSNRSFISFGVKKAFSDQSENSPF